MSNDVFSFVVENLYYISIERPILKHYRLGMQNSSNLPSKLNSNDSGEYIISGTKKTIKLYLEIQEEQGEKYNITCFPT